MKIVFSSNIESEDFRIEANEDECGVEGIKKLAGVFQDQMRHAFDAAHLVWEKFPEFKQVTFDTMTDEERKIMESMKHIGKGEN